MDTWGPPARPCLPAVGAWFVAVYAEGARALGGSRKGEPLARGLGIMAECGQL